MRASFREKDDIDENNNIKGDYDFSILLKSNPEKLKQLNEENSKLNYVFGKKLTNDNYDNLIKFIRNKHDFIYNQTQELLKSGNSFDVFKETIRLNLQALKTITLNEQDLYYVYKYALAINGLAIEFINQQTEELCLIAVNNNDMH